MLDEVGGETDTEPVIGDHGPAQAARRDLVPVRRELFLREAGRADDGVEPRVEIGAHIVLKDRRRGKIYRHVRAARLQRLRERRQDRHSQLLRPRRDAYVEAGLLRPSSDKLKSLFRLDSLHDRTSYIS